MILISLKMINISPIKFHFKYLCLFTVRTLEKAKITGNFAAESCEVSKSEPVNIGNYHDSESESSDSETGRAVRHPKKLKIATLH